MMPQVLLVEAHEGITTHIYVLGFSRANLFSTQGLCETFLAPNPTESVSGSFINELCEGGALGLIYFE